MPPGTGRQAGGRRSAPRPGTGPAYLGGGPRGGSGRWPAPAGGPAASTGLTRRGRAGPARPARRVRLRRGKPGRRLSISMVAILFVLTMYAGRLIQLQGLDWSYYRTVSEAQLLRTVSIPVVRGEITTSDGVVLAVTVQTDTVFADPAEIPVAERAPVAAALAAPLGMQSAAILALIRHPSSPDYVVLKDDVPQATGAAIMRIRLPGTTGPPGLPGIAEHPTYTREYPNGRLAANVVGFTTSNAAGDLHGDAGIEYGENGVLAGREGTEEVETGTNGAPIPGTATKITPQVPASNVRLTIQSDIQWEAEQACRLRALQTRARTCTIVVMRPTGQILAFAQYPTFNPAAPPSVAATTDLPVAEVFQPGSTAKIITASAAFERGGQTPMSSYVVPDRIVVDGFPFRDAEYHPTQRYTIAGIIANSLNDGMVQVVRHVRPDIQYAYLRKFGLGSPSGLNLPGESKGILPPPAQWPGDERYTLSFGQGLAVTAVQMASVYATVANGGVRVQPTIVAGTTSATGQYRPAPAPTRTRVIKAKTASELMAILQQVPYVDAAAGVRWGLIPGYSIAAKTGTAQEPDPQKGGCLCEYGSSYIGIAPASHPQVVVAVNIQDPRKGSYFGDEVAGPAFYRVMRFALQTLKIPPDGGHRPNVRLTVP